MKNIAISILFLTLLSCQQKGEHKKVSKRIDLLIETEKQISLNFTQVFDTCYIIPLETIDSAMVGSIDKIIFGQVRSAIRIDPLRQYELTHF